MSRWGIGGKLILFSLPYAIAVKILTLMYPNLFEIRVLPYKYMVIVSSLFLLIGVTFLIKSAYEFTIGFNAGKLLTDGMYSIVRNPIYSAWIFFLIPGFALLLKSWLVLTTTVITYLVFKYFIREEEKYLENKFGKRYLQYKSQVNQIVPLPQSFKIKDNKRPNKSLERNISDW